MDFSRRRRTVVCAGLVLSALLGACAQPPLEARPYTPQRGQAGKDVVWIPTPDDVVQRMLDMAQVTAQDRLVDLGSGDGKITIAAARRGARAKGIEYNPDMVALSRRLAREQGVQAEFMQGDIFKSDFSDADVVTLYLLPELNERLRPILLAMKPGTRVVSHEFDMGDWRPDRMDQVGTRHAYFWVVPAKVAGEWRLQVDGAPPLEVRFEQRYQQLEGRLLRAGAPVALVQPQVRGAGIAFQVPDAAGGTMRFEGTADHAGRMSGFATGADGRRRPFEAVRLRPA
jgi:SAM-dependent methyltransferase